MPQTKSKRFPWSLLGKFVLGGGLFYYILKQQMLDLPLLENILSRPLLLLIAFAFILLITASMTARWALFTKFGDLSTTFWPLLKITMISTFLSTFLPGSVGLDAVRSWYLVRTEKEQSFRAILTVIWDRGIGVGVMCVSAAVASLFFRDVTTLHPELTIVSLTSWVLVALSLGFYLCFLSGILKRPLPHALRRIQPFWEAFHAFRPSIAIVSKTLMYSVLGTLATIFLFAVVGDAMGTKMPMISYFFIVPVGLLASAIPFFPAGIGIGQVAFYHLFLWSGSNDPAQGATLCTIIQIYHLLFNGFGGVFYLEHRGFNKRPKFDNGLSK